MISYFPLILASVSLNAFAKLFLKKGMLTIGYFDFSLTSVMQVFFKVAGNPFIFGGLACYVFSLGLWMLVLSRVEVSFAYPFLSLGYIITAVAGYAIFYEHLSFNRIAGIFLICFSVVLISKS